MNKIRVIDLLNKIANGEDVPKKIKHNNIIYTWDIVGYLHYEDEHYSERAFLEGYRTDMCLNDRVEIIEDTPKEDKKIEKLELLQFSDLIDMPNDGIMVVIKDNRNKINEIIKRLNGE